MVRLLKPRKKLSAKQLEHIALQKRSFRIPPREEHDEAAKYRFEAMDKIRTKQLLVAKKENSK